MVVSPIRCLFAALLLIGPPTVAGAQGVPSIDAGTIVLRDVSFGEAGRGKIASVELSSMARTGKTVRARTVKIEGLTFSSPLVTVEMPSMIISDFEGEGDLVDALSGGRLSRVEWPDVLYDAKASKVDIPTMTYRIKNAGGEQVVTSTGMVFEDLDEGVFATMTVGAQNSVLTAPDPQNSMTSQVGVSKYEEVDVAEIVRIFHGGGEGEADVLVAEATTQAVEWQVGNATSRIGTMSSSGFYGRAPTVGLGYEDFLRLIADEGKTDQELRRKFVAWLRDLAKYFRVEAIDASGLEFKTPDGGASIAEMTLQGLRLGGLDLFELTNLEAKSDLGPITLGRFAIEGLDYGTLLDMGLTGFETGNEDTPAASWKDFPKLKAIRFQKFDASAAVEPVSFDEVALETTEADGLLSGIVFYLKGLKTRLDQGIPNEGKARMLALGYTQLSADAQFAVKYEAATQSLVIEKTGASVADAGAVFTTIRLGGFKPELMVGEAEARALGMQLTLDGMQIDITDAGLAQRFYASIAKDAGVSPDAIRDGLAAEMRSQAQALLGDALEPGSADALGDFLRQPGKLTVRVAPRPGQPLLTLAEIQSDNPPVLADRLRIEITAGN